jgi:hypothetical protein
MSFELDIRSDTLPNLTPQDAKPNIRRPGVVASAYAPQPLDWPSDESDDDIADLYRNVPTRHTHSLNHHSRSRSRSHYGVSVSDSDSHTGSQSVIFSQHRFGDFHHGTATAESDDAGEHFELYHRVSWWKQVQKDPVFRCFVCSWRVVSTILFVCVMCVSVAFLFHSEIANPVKVHAASECMPRQELGIITERHQEEVCSAGRCDVTTSIDTLPKRLQLMLQYHPVVIHDSEERYFPVSMNDFVTKSSLRHGHDILVDIPKLTLDLAQQFSSQYRDPLDPLSIVPPHDTWTGTSPSQLSDVPMYADIQLVCPVGQFMNGCDRNETSIDRPMWEMRYIFLYAYNGAENVLGMFHAGAHTGDLEHILVHVPWNQNSALSEEQVHKMSRVYYARHYCEGEFYEFGTESSDGDHTAQILRSSNMPTLVETWPQAYQTILVNGSHPIVYSSRNAHASYSQCGVLPRSTWRRDIFEHDRNDARGAVWWPNQIIPFTPHTSLQPFLQKPGGNLMYNYRGLWGEIESVAAAYWYLHLTGCHDRDMIETIEAKAHIPHVSMVLLVAAITITLLIGMFSCCFWCHDAVYYCRYRKRMLEFEEAAVGYESLQAEQL